MSAPFKILCGLEKGDEQSEFELVTAMILNEITEAEIVRLLFQSRVQYKSGGVTNRVIGLCTMIGFSHILETIYAKTGRDLSPFSEVPPAVIEELNEKQALSQRPKLQFAIFKLAYLVNESGDTLAASLVILGFYLLRSGKLLEKVLHENKTSEPQEG
jgi:hypothetical protein